VPSMFLRVAATVVSRKPDWSLMRRETSMAQRQREGEPGARAKAVAQFFGSVPTEAEDGRKPYFTASRVAAMVQPLMPR
jgi:hypothetical protein